MKSHFKFTRAQQYGILLLLASIVILQAVHFFVDGTNDAISNNTEDLEVFEKELDSLRLIKIENNKPKIYPFNPNYITDYKGYTLGMSAEEIDRLHNYRDKNLWINSARDFQKVTQVSDSLLNAISPFFKFPEWVTNPKPKTFNSSVNYNKELSYSEKIDLNKATANQLQRVNGIGEKLSERIIRFRNKFKGGFIADVQLNDVYGLTPDVIDRVTNQFTVKTPRQIQKIRLNKASVEELVTIQHIDYDLAYEIVDQRTLRDSFKDINELTKVKDFPIDKIEIIKLYLTLD